MLLIILFGSMPIAGGVAYAFRSSVPGWDAVENAVKESVELPKQGSTSCRIPDDPKKKAQVEHDFDTLKSFVKDVYHTYAQLPPDSSERLSETWALLRKEDVEPLDPYDGYPYGYAKKGKGRFVIWSVGRDGEAYTEDDMHIEGDVTEFGIEQFSALEQGLEGAK